jgi:hypothetical protein
MPSCCDAMYDEEGLDDKIISAPPKRKGASLTIQYALPRRAADSRRPKGEKWPADVIGAFQRLNPPDE